MKYRKKPIIIDAIQFNGENYKECETYVEGNYDNTLNYPNIITSEGIMRVNVGDYIIKEPFDKERGFYPCKPDIFEQTYELAEIPNDCGLFGHSEVYKAELMKSIQEAAESGQSFARMNGTSIEHVDKVEVYCKDE